MSQFKNFSILFLILFFLMLSGCGFVRGFNGGYHHRHYNFFDDSYGPNNYNTQNHSNYDRGC